MSNKIQLPEELQKTINNFYNTIMSGESHIIEVFDEITQDALRGNDNVGGGEAADTFYYLKNIRDFIVNLQIYAR